MQAIPLTGVAAFLILVVAGNLIGAVYDHFGAFGITARPFSSKRLMGWCSLWSACSLQYGHSERRL
jgi:uncharacterized membrane protein YdcZ (DUF606 family)